MSYLSTSKISQQFGIHPQTVRRWCRTGQLQEHHRTPGNHRRFSPPAKEDGEVVGYVRVSSADQKSDLVVQELALHQKAKTLGLTVTRTLQDVGSGMNYRKKGFVQLFGLLLSGKVKHLILMHKDRLLRFGSEIIFLLCRSLNIQVTVLEPSLAKSPTEQLCLDLIEIMTVFTNKIYGMRSHSNTKILNAQLCPTSSPAV